MDWQYIINAIPKFVDATILTLYLAGAGIFFSLIIGIICAVLIVYPVPVLSRFIKAYIEISRNTPLLIQIFFLYFGVAKLGIKLDSITCAIISLAFLGGSYMAEAFRGGLLAVSKGQIEAAFSIGLKPLQVFRYVIFPQAFAVSIPAIGANCLFLIKETSIVSAIAITELMFLAKEIIGMDYKTNEALFLLIVFYLIILLPLSLFVRYLEKRQRRASYGV